MSTVEKFISPLISNQFPDFYKEQGPLFVLFVEEYFKWLESNDPNYSTYDNSEIAGNPNYHMRRLLEYKDVDLTVDEFVQYIKGKYFSSFKLISPASQKRLIKAAQDIYSSKGTERSIDLLFKIVFGTKVKIYNPAEDILKPSSGLWVIPKYLEVTRTSRNSTFPGKEIKGSTSNATAFVEYVITRNVKGRLVDVLFLSSIDGEFIPGELVTDNNLVQNAPIITGSLSFIDVTTGGQQFSVGEIVDIISTRGIEGKARISSISDVTGIIEFTIIDGGWGYSNTANVIISTKVLNVTNTVNSNAAITSYEKFETLQQTIFSINTTSIKGQITANQVILNGNGTPSEAVTVRAIQNTSSPNTANIIINSITGNFFSNSIFYLKNKAIIATNTNVFNVGDAVIQHSGGSNNVSGIVESVSNVCIVTVNTSSISANGIQVGNFVQQLTTGATGTISITPRENFYSSSNVNLLSLITTTGTFNNTSTINVYSNSSKTTLISTFDPLEASNGYQYVLKDTNLTSNTRWSTSNTAIKVLTPTVNTVIKIASDVSGISNAHANSTATGIVVGSNTSAVGVYQINNVFYANEKTIVFGQTSNTFSNSTIVSSGQGADFDVGNIENAETVLLPTDTINSNNDGPGSNSVKFSSMLISGANSTYGNLSGVYIASSGSGYDNTDVVTFTGGNTGAGSFQAGNATIITDGSGIITTVILSANTGNGIITTPAANVITSTGSGANLIPLSSLGFIKLPAGNINSPIIDLLNFQTKTIGTITSLKNINPGEDYTIEPFVLVQEPLVASYGKKDFILNLNVTSGSGFINNEQIEQTQAVTGTLITSNNFSGNAVLSYNAYEVVYSTDGISNTATGIVYQTSLSSANVYTTVLNTTTGTWQNTINVTILTVSSNSNFDPGNLITQGAASGVLVTSNTTKLVVKSVVGTFAANSTNVTSNSTPTAGDQTILSTSNTKIYKLIGRTTNGVTDILDVDPYSSTVLAKGIIINASNTQAVAVKRISLFTDFEAGGTVTGRTSSTNGTIVSVLALDTSNTVGENAIILADTVVSNGSIKSLVVDNSGFGYENNSQVTIVSADGVRAATGKGRLGSPGTGTGFYSSTDGFLSDEKYIIDGEYYQPFSYEVQTGIPLDIYSGLLKEVLHVAGKKFFGRVTTQNKGNINISGNSTITVA